jgi:hypothetical protein
MAKWLDRRMPLGFRLNPTPISATMAILSEKHPPWIYESAGLTPSLRTWAKRVSKLVVFFDLKGVEP